MTYPSTLRPGWRLGVVAALLTLTAACGEESEAPSAPEVQPEGPGGPSNLPTAPEAQPGEPGEPFDPQLTFEDRVWQHRVDAAFAPSECPDTPEVEPPVGSYAGKLFDTHFHIPHIPDSPPGAEPGESELEDFGEGPFDDWMFEPEESNPIRAQLPLAGKNITITELACLLRSDGTDGAFAFFPVFPHIQDQLLDLARRSMDEHADVFVPFIMPPGPHDAQPTVEADTLQEMVSTYPGLFVGYGELGLYAIEGVRGTEFAPDAPIFEEIYPVVHEHGLMVYLHPGDGHADNLANALASNPDITFIAHADQIENDIGDLMDRFPNIFYTVNAIYGDQYLLRPEETIKSFLAATDDYGPLLEADWAKWKDIIEEHPNRFMWGTDRGGPAVWTFDLQVSLRLVDYARAFIGGLDADVQERFAYDNAARLIANAGSGVGY